MFKAAFNYLALALAYVRFNFRAHLEYRAAFIWQVLAMLINDCVWIAFWIMFFTRFPVLHGWTVNDVITMWALAASGFGFAHAVCGNSLFLPGLIAKGQLDSWMMYPRSLLPHLLVGKMEATAWGDAIFGFVVYMALVKPDPLHFAMFTILVLAIAVLFVGFSIMSGSIGFFVGNAESLCTQWRFAMITFSTYPGALFDGATKMLLFTVIPAAFINYVPIEALKRFSLTDALITICGSGLVLLVGVALFHAGLRRYESGNLMEMRG